MTKLQIPRNLQAPSSKAVAARVSLELETSRLGFLLDFELRIWSL